MSKHSEFIVLLLALLFMPIFSNAAFPATHYIDYMSGSDSNNGKSISTPWKRCPGMVGFAGRYSHSAGDVFVFKGGVTWPATGNDSYVLNVSYSGAVGNHDIYMGGQQCGKTGSVYCNGGTAWGNGYPVFDGRAIDGMLAVSNYANNAIQQYFTIDGLRIQNVGYTDGSGQGISLSGGSGITVKNCWLQPNGVNAFAYGISSGSYSALYFHDNIIMQAGRIHVSVGNATCDDFRFYNNTMYGAGNPYYNPHHYHNDGFMIGADGVGSNKATNLKIYNNKFLGDWSGGATALIYLNGTPSALYGWKDVSIFNNLLVTESNRGATLSPAVIFIAGGHSDVKIYNNTIDTRSNATPVGTCISIAYEISNIDIQNNILAGCDNGVALDATTTDAVKIDYNLYDTVGHDHLIINLMSSVNSRCNTVAECQRSPFYQEAHGKVGDPKFAARPGGGVGSGNWHLQAESPAGTGGTNLGAPYTTDIDGIFGPGRIGAYTRK